MRCENSVCMVAERSFLLDAESGYAGSEYEEGGGAGVDGAIVHGLM